MNGEAEKLERTRGWVAGGSLDFINVAGESRIIHLLKRLVLIVAREVVGNNPVGKRGCRDAIFERFMNENASR